MYGQCEIYGKKNKLQQFIDKISLKLTYRPKDWIELGIILPKDDWHGEY